MLCIKGCGFYGSQDRKGYCSVCYEETPIPTQEVKLKKRCFSCNKKLGISGFLCKCNNTYCSKHRYYFEHKCTFDHKKYEKEKLKKNNPMIKKEKLEKI